MKKALLLVALAVCTATAMAQRPTRKAQPQQPQAQPSQFMKLLTGQKKAEGTKTLYCPKTITQQQIAPDGSVEYELVYEITYNEKGQATKGLYTAPDGLTYVVEISYDEHGNILEEVVKAGPKDMPESEFVNRSKFAATYDDVVTDFKTSNRLFRWDEEKGWVDISVPAPKAPAKKIPGFMDTYSIFMEGSYKIAIERDEQGRVVKFTKSRPYPGTDPEVVVDDEGFTAYCGHEVVYDETTGEAVSMAYTKDNTFFVVASPKPKAPAYSKDYYDYADNMTWENTDGQLLISCEDEYLEGNNRLKSADYGWYEGESWVTGGHETVTYSEDGSYYFNYVEGDYRWEKGKLYTDENGSFQYRDQETFLDQVDEDGRTKFDAVITEVKNDDHGNTVETRGYTESGYIGEATTKNFSYGKFTDYTYDEETDVITKEETGELVWDYEIGDVKKVTEDVYLYEDFEEIVVDGIQESVVKEPVAKTDNHRYNLAGQRVGRDYKGVVIQNGKKFIQ